MLTVDYIRIRSRSGLLVLGTMKMSLPFDLFRWFVEYFRFTVRGLRLLGRPRVPHGF